MAINQTNTEVEYDAATGSLKEKAVKAGLPAAPSSVAGADALGATADQKKMIGTPNQLPAQFGTGTGESAAKQTEAPAPPQPGQKPQTLEQADRQAALTPQAPSVADAQAQQRREEMKKAYGDVGLGVDNMIRAAIAKRSTVPASTGYQVDTSALEELPQWTTATPELKAAAQSALADLGANPADAKKYQAAQRALAAAGLDPTAISSILKQQSTAQLTADQVADEVPVDMAALQSFGISPEDLALVGLTPQQVQGMSLAQFQTRLREGLQSNADQVASLQKQLQDPALDPNAKRAIQEQLRALGAVGGYKAEQDIQGILDNQIADPDARIQIGSRDYSVEELLDDDNMSGLIQEYLDSPEGSDVRKQLDSKFPDLAKFIGENGDTLKKASDALTTTGGEVQKTQKENTTIMQNLKDAGVSSTDAQALLKSMFPEMGDQFSLNKIDASKSGLLQALMNPSALGVEIKSKKGRDSFNTAMKQLVSFSQKNPQLGAELAALSTDELKKLGAFEGSPRWTSFVQSLADSKFLATAKPAELAEHIFGTTDYKEAWRTMDALRRTGNTYDADALQKVLDSNPKDGKMDAASSIKSALQKRAKSSPSSLRDLLDGGTPRTLPSLKKKTTTVAAALAPALKDGRVTTDEATKVADRLSTEELRDLVEGGGITGRVDGGVGPALKKLLATRIRTETTKTAWSSLKKANLPSSFKGFLEGGVVPGGLTSGGMVTIQDKKMQQQAREAITRLQEIKKSGKADSAYLSELIARLEAAIPEGSRFGGAGKNRRDEKTDPMKAPTTVMQAPGKTVKKKLGTLQDSTKDFLDRS